MFKSQLLLSATVAALVAAGSQAAPSPQAPAPHVCKDLYFYVTATGSVDKITLPPVDSNTQLLDQLLSSVVSGVTNLLPGLLTSVIPHTGTYKLRGHYCEPVDGVKKDTIQFLNHGVTYTYDYWDWPQSNEQYSYQRFAAEQGYATLSIDRLGSGESDKPDPIGITQLNYQAAISDEVIRMLKAGEIAEIGRSFPKAVFVGHSIGSVIGNLVAVNRPKNVDGVVFTGYTQAIELLQASVLLSARLLPAVLVNEVKFAGQALYLTNANYDGRLAFYGEKGEFDPALVAFDNDRRGSFSFGEALTATDGAQTANDFDKPVYIITGNHDKVFCGASTQGLLLQGSKCSPDSTPASLVAGSRQRFPKSDFEFKVVEGSGHVLNLHYRAREYYQEIHDWLARKGF